MYKAGRSFIKDLPKTELLAMRENGMSNAEIARKLSISYNTVLNLIGRQPESTTSASRSNAKARRQTRMDGTPAFMEVTTPTVKDEEPARAVLAVKSSTISLCGAFMNYCISADRAMIDVETSEGRCLMQIPSDKIDLFIDELKAIKNNINDRNFKPFWG